MANNTFGYCFKGWTWVRLSDDAQTEIIREVGRKSFDKHAQECPWCKAAELARQGEIIRAAKGEEVEARR